MRRLHPSLHLLQAFISTARHSNISAAARELHLTQSAVSKQVLELERVLGVPLFHRERGRLALSPAGAAYLPAVTQAVTLIEGATLELISGAGPGHTLNLATVPTFGAKWLIPRLPHFQKSHPEVAINFVHYARGNDFSAPELDCAIRYGSGHWPGARAHYLAGREVIVIGPRERRGQPPLRRLQDVARYTLLQHAISPDAWSRWCDALHVEHPAPLAGPRLEQITSMVRAVVAGLGLGLVPRCMVQDDIDNGLVVDVFRRDFISDGGYFLCYPESKANAAAVKVFRDWALEQAGPNLAQISNP